MKLGRLQNIANQLCQMATGWRWAQDSEWMKTFPDSRLSIDLAKGRTLLDGRKSPLVMPLELCSWFGSECERLKTQPGQFKPARMRIRFIARRENRSDLSSCRPK